jgi:predicted nucleic acid-binding Zn finger protein
MEQTIVSKKFVNEESRILRECRGRRLSISHRVLMMRNSKSHFYVKSESKDIFYFVEYKTDSQFCTCWDYASNRSDKCKHIFAVEYALRLNLVQQIDKKLPIAQKVGHNSDVSALTPSKTDVSIPIHSETVKELTKLESSGTGSLRSQHKQSIAEQYKGLSIATLNEMEKAEIEAENYSRGTQRVQRWEDDSYDF